MARYKIVVEALVSPTLGSRVVHKYLPSFLCLFRSVDQSEVVPGIQIHSETDVHLPDVADDLPDKIFCDVKPRVAGNISRTEYRQFWIFRQMNGA